MVHWNSKQLAITLLSALILRVSADQIVFQSETAHSSNYEVASLVRTINVAGSITREQDVIKLRKKAGVSSKPTWILPIEDQRASNMSSMEVIRGEGKETEGQSKNLLNIIPRGFDSERGIHLFEIEGLPKESELTLTVNLQFLGLTVPKPDQLVQSDGPKQGMYWKGDLLGGLGSLPGGLAKDVDIKVKIISPTPKVFGKISPAGFDAQHAGGSSSVVFVNKLGGDQLSKEPQQGFVHFHQPHPVMVIGNLTRLVEVSHWGNNVAFEDKIQLENRGAKLKGSFSRFVHQTTLYGKIPGATAHVLTGLTLQLPQGAQDPYYIDTIGNVSTSRFRPSLPPQSTNPKKPTKLNKSRKEAKYSQLELVPRYPIAGSWNYSFTIGYNLEAGRVLRQKSEAEYVLKVPFFTNVIDVPVEQATLRIRLPEGASNIKVVTPFPPSEMQTDLIDKTYLDTTGRPTIFIKKFKCTEKHSGDIYVSYSRSPIRSLQKPAAVAGWMMTIFLLAAGLMRFDRKIGHV